MQAENEQSNSVVASFPQGERVWLHSAYIASLGETDTERKTYTETERGLEKTEKQTQPREFIDVTGRTRDTITEI